MDLKIIIYNNTPCIILNYDKEYPEFLLSSICEVFYKSDKIILIKQRKKWVHTYVHNWDIIISNRKRYIDESKYIDV